MLPIFACGPIFLCETIYLNVYLISSKKRPNIARMFVYLNGYWSERANARMRSRLPLFFSSLYLSMPRNCRVVSRTVLCLLMFLPTSSAYRYHDCMAAKRQIIVYMHFIYVFVGISMLWYILCVLRSCGDG